MSNTMTPIDRFEATMEDYLLSSGMPEIIKHLRAHYDGADLKTLHEARERAADFTEELYRRMGRGDMGRGDVRRAFLAVLDTETPFAEDRASHEGEARLLKTRVEDIDRQIGKLHVERANATSRLEELDVEVVPQVDSRVAETLKRIDPTGKVSGPYPDMR